MSRKGYLGGGFLSAFLDLLSPVVKLRGDPIVEIILGGSPGASGLAIYGDYFYLMDIVNTKIHVYTLSGTFVRSMTPPRNYTDIDYDPLNDELLGVGSAQKGVDRLSKTDASLIGNYGASESAYLNFYFTSIAIDRENDRCYLMRQEGASIYVMKPSIWSWVKNIYLPFFWSPTQTITSTMIIALDGVDRTNIWVGYKSFPPLFSRLAEDRVDEFRVLGVSFNQSKSSIAVRFYNGKWYYWGDFIGGVGRLFELKTMPVPVIPYVPQPFPEFAQDIYRWYEDDGAENPTPRVSENTSIIGVTSLEILRLRLGLKEKTGTRVVWSGLPKFQYATDPAGPWTDVGEKTDTDKAWRFYDGLGVDGAEILNLLLSNTTVKQYFVESYPSRGGLAYRAPDRGEWDVCIEAYDPLDHTDYYLKAIVDAGLIKEYSVYPKFKTDLLGWKGWKYKKEITIIEQASGTYNDYPTIITVPYNSHMKSDFSDCRLVETDGSRIQHGIVEKEDGVSCSFVILRSYTPGCTNKVYLYYGKPSVADSTVDHGPWALAWYQNQGFGPYTIASQSAPSCDVYNAATFSGDVPSWADIVLGGVQHGGARWQCYAGRVKINGTPVKWATAVCPIPTSKLLKWKKYLCTNEQYDHPSFIIGGNNTIDIGHFDGGNPGWRCSWYPTDPLITIGPEEPL